MAQPYSGPVLQSPPLSEGPQPYDGPVVHEGQQASPAMSPLAKAPPQAQPQQPAQQAPAQGKVSPTILEAINRPADRTVELMGQSVQQTADSIKALVQHPGVKSATNAALNVIGLPFSPITSTVDAFLGDPAVQLAHQLGASRKVDPYIRAAAQTVLPIAGSGGALAKALGPAGQFLTGSNIAPVVGQPAERLATQLIQHDRAAVAREVQLKKGFEDFISAHPDYKQHDEEIYHATEDPNHKLSPGAAYFKKTYIDPMRRRNDLYVDELKNLGVRLPKVVNPSTYIHRQPIEQAASKGFVGTIADIVDPTGTLSSQRFTKGFGTHPSSLQTPNAGVSFNPATGERGGYVIDQYTNEADVYKNGKVIDKGTFDPKTETITGKTGANWSIERGTTKEVEQHTPIQYQKSAIASIIDTQRQLRDAVDNAKFINNLKTSPEFRSMAHPPKMPAPQDWKTFQIEGYDRLNGWKMDPELHEVLTDYAHGGAMETNTLLQGMNRIMQGSIFLNPVGHILNVQFHAAVEAGLFGGAVRLANGAVRAITSGEKTMTRQAVEAVITKNSDYLRYVKESAGLRGANNYVRDFGNNILREMGKNPQQLAPVAQALGYANPFHYLRAVYRASNATLWGVGDMILMKSFLEREAGMGAGHEAQIATHVHEHVPDYVIPSRVAGSRSMSQLLQHPLLLGFSRYEYNRLASYGNLMRGVIQPGRRLEGADQIAALIFHAAVTYPLINYAVQKVTGNPNASFRPFGPFIYTEGARAYAQGKKTFAQAAIQTVARPSATIETLMELYQGKDWAGRSIYGSAGKFIKYLSTKTFPTQAISRIVSPPKSVTTKQAVRQFLFDQVGIKTPTPEQEAITEKYARLELKRRAKE